MPYKTNTELPDSIKNALPEKAQDIFREVFNNSSKKYDEARSFATAWAAVRGAGYKKVKGKWQKVEKSFEQRFEFVSKNNEKKQVFGWANIAIDESGVQIEDSQEDMIDVEDLEKMAYKFTKLYRDAGEMHINKGKATMIESIVFTPEKQKALGIESVNYTAELKKQLGKDSGPLPAGWWIGFEVTDDEVWEKVKDGTYKAFSIEGTAKRIPV